METKINKGIFTSLIAIALFTPVALSSKQSHADTTQSNTTEGTNNSTQDTNNDSSDSGHAQINETQERLNDETRISDAKAKLMSDQNQANKNEQSLLVSASVGLPNINDQDQKNAQDNANAQFNKDESQINNAQIQFNTDQDRWNGGINQKQFSNNSADKNEASHSSNDASSQSISFPNAPVTKISANHKVKDHKHVKFSKRFRLTKKAAAQSKIDSGYVEK